jgi:predicted esterase
MSLHSAPEHATTQSSVHLIATEIHGRYLVKEPAVPSPWPVLVGFHGHGEEAADQLREMASIPGTDAWLLVSIQALHPFYTRNQERVVATWMTRLDREHAIADNIAYVGRVLDEVRRNYQTRTSLAFAGFSQGGAMAYRAAAHYPAQALIILAADVPPDVSAGPRVPLPPTLIGRGTRDEWYTEAKQDADVRALAGIGVHPELCVFEGGHVWSDPFREAAMNLLRRASV